MEIELLKDIVIIFALSIVVIFIFHKFRIPPIIGFLLTGVVAGPFGLGVIRGVEEVELLAEIGIILLLFTIGIEFSLKNLMKTKRAVLLGGSLQVGLVIAFTFAITHFLGFDAEKAIFLGFLVALSSTAVVMKIIQSKGELGSFHGKITVALLIFQDIIVVPMILFVPILGGATTDLSSSILSTLVKVAGVILLTYLSAKYLVPRLLYQIARTQSRELFLITIIVIGFAAAWLTASIGLSLALGAFVAGLIISESEYSEQAIGNIIPFRDLFTSFFFVSVGMLLNIGFILENPVLVFGIAAGVLVLKTIVSGFVAFVLGYPFRTTVIVGVSISQVGEFSFLLSEIGMDYNLLDESTFQIFLSSAVLSISATPFLIAVAPRLADWVLKFNMPRTLRCGLSNLPEPTFTGMKDHLIIIGYGLNGKNVARAAKFADIPHVIIEMNPDTVKEELAKGEIIYYGDATQEDILRHGGVENALILVSTLPNPADTRQVILQARKMNPHVHIIIRTRFFSDVDSLYQLGADEVIPEEFETSVEIFTRVLAKFLVPQNEIEKLVAELRSDGYQMFRGLSVESEGFTRLTVGAPTVDIHSYHVGSGAELDGRTIGSAGFDQMGVSLLALSRGSEVISQPSRNTVIRENDILFFLGTGKEPGRLNEMFRGKEPQKQ